LEQVIAEGARKLLQAAIENEGKLTAAGEPGPADRDARSPLTSSALKARVSNACKQL
jgi:hypothetical protein